MSSKKVEIGKWETPFIEGDLWIVSVDWGYQRFSIGLSRGYEYMMNAHKKDYELSIKVFHVPTESVYEVNFEAAETFRVLDERGLLDIWGAEGWKGVNTAKVRGHPWSEESFLEFFSHSTDGWSFLIATDWTCVEVVTESEPDIVFVEKLEEKDFKKE